MVNGFSPVLPGPKCVTIPILTLLPLFLFKEVFNPISLAKFLISFIISLDDDEIIGVPLQIYPSEIKYPRSLGKPFHLGSKLPKMGRLEGIAILSPILNS
ncbi:hypothetical protein ES708_34587 [subsurface metagenome]